MAKLTLDGSALKPKIPSYVGYLGTIIPWSKYRETDIEGMPKNLQLLVFLMKLTERSLTPSFREYVAAKIVEPRMEGTKFVKITKTQLAEIFPHAGKYSSVAEYLGSTDGISDLERLARSEDGLKTANQKKFRQSLRREYIKIQDKDRFAAVVEALSMTMRGHNRNLTKRDEAHKPACPFGAYLNILKAFADPTLGLETDALSALSGVTIQRCD